MSTSGLWSFLQGGEPQHGTSRKLQRWFVGKGQHRVAEGPDAELARAALNLLLQEWPLLARDEASRRIAVLLETLAAERGLAVPRWLTEEEPAPKKKPGI